MIDDEAIIQEFIEESLEHLSGIEGDLLAIEQAGAGADSSLINDVFRAIHTVKGGAGFLGLDKIKELSHNQENLLNKLRNKELTPTKEIMNVLLTTIDLLHKMVEEYADSNSVDISQPIEDLLRVSGEGSQIAPAKKKGKGKGKGKGKEKEKEKEEENQNPLLYSIPKEILDSEIDSGSNIYFVELLHPDDLKPLGKSLKEFLEECWQTGNILNCSMDTGPLLAGEEVSEEDIPEKVSFIFSTIIESSLIDSLIPVPQERCFILPPNLIDQATTTICQKNLENPEPAKEPEPAPIQENPAPTPALASTGSKKPSKAVESNIRVNLKTLDSLMSLTSELVLARNELTKKIRDLEGSSLEGLAQRLDAITSNLQLAVMSTRMQPLGKVFNKFKRVVRDLANMLDKKIDLVIQGETVELDKTIVETIGDPLTHLVRNAIDHGIEGPGDRTSKGKPETGTLCLKAYHEAGQVVIEIIDDGKGIDVEKVKEKALANKLHDKAYLDGMSDKEAQRLIFKPGFSMAKEVTEISGRGVGMDVVYTNFSKIGGIVDVESTLGAGTTVQIKLPLTLAIIPSLLVSVQEEVFAVPQANMIELVSFAPEKIKEQIHELAGYEVLRLREKLLPLVELRQVLEMPNVFTHPETGEELPNNRQRIDRRASETEKRKREEEEEEGNLPERETSDRRKAAESYVNIVVVASGSSHYGLIVNEFLDSEEIVVKPLDPCLKDCRCYAGATIQGNGKVALILDILGISEHINLGNNESAIETSKENLVDNIDSDDQQNILIFDNGTEEQYAVPLTVVSRIERIETKQVQITGNRANMNYRGETLPIFRIHEIEGVEEGKQEAFASVLVFSIAGKELGLMVHDIQDVHTLTTQIDEMTFQRPGILGSSVINDKATLILDVYGMVGAIHPEWLEDMRIKQKGDEKPKVLLVEDSKFYRKHICDFLTENGCDVTAAEDGMEGLREVEDPEQAFDLIFTDIEMPNMTGLEMTKKIRSDSRFSNLPIVAVTSLTGTECEKEGLEAGVTEYLVKLNKDDISHCLKKYLKKR